MEGIGLVAGRIAHDFNNMLAAIVGNLSLIRLAAEKNPSAVHDLIDKAEKGAMRAKTLSVQMLTFADGGTPVRRPESVDDIVRSHVAFSGHLNAMERTIDIPPDLPMVLADAGQIGLVIENLISNAEKAMPDGGTVRVSAKEEVVHPGPPRGLLPGPYVRVTVADSGVGIADDLLLRIFEPFYSTSTDGLGMGLGLPASHSIVKKHGGTIEVDSAVGKGSAFHLFLPVAVGVRRSVVTPKAIDPDAALKRILVMDDEELVREVAVGMLLALGYEAEAVHEGGKAIERYMEAKAAGRPFDAVLLDITVPGGMGGKETIGRLLAIDPDVRAIVSSGYANNALMSEHRAHGFSGVIAKPYRIADLGEVVASVLV